MSNFMKIAVSVFVTIIVVGGGVFYFMDKQSTDDKNALNVQVSDLQSQVSNSSIPATTVPSTVTTDTTSSGRYVNAKFGFSFTLPSGYALQEEPMYEGAEGVSIRFGKNSTNNVSEYNFVKLQYQKDNSTIATLESGFVKDGGSDLSDRKELTVGGQKAISYLVGGLASGKTILAANGSATIQLSVYPDSDSTKAFVDNIAASFQFSK